VLHEAGADFLVADFHHVVVAGVGGLHVGPLRQQLLGAAIHLGRARRSGRRSRRLVGDGQHALGFAQLLAFARQRHLLAVMRW
jgi:hypothetical protein